MVYITVMQPPKYHQMTLEEFLFGVGDQTRLINKNDTNTKTYEFEFVSEKFRKLFDIDELIAKLHAFNEQTAALRAVENRHDLYREFKIPKKSGGYRPIKEPHPELMDALRRLKTIFEVDFRGLYHTSAFAYIRGRSTIKCMQRHQENESKWFGKYDLRDFFGSTTLDFVMDMLAMVFPFSEVCSSTAGREELRTAVELAFLDGGLPQGTPISPMITNLMMIPVDFALNKKLRDYNRQRFVCTRYADDFQISSKYTFSFKEIEGVIIDTLNSFNAPFQINSKKTRYGSSAGSNWNLGVMLNKDNELTVGYQAKRRFQAALSSYIMDKKKGIVWDIGDLQSLEGYYKYYSMVEGDTIDKMVSHINEKFGVNVIKMIKEDLRG